MLRFFTVYGPRQRPDLAIHKFAKLISAGKPIQVYGDGSTRGIIPTSATSWTASSPARSGSSAMRFSILGNSQSVTLSHLIELLEKALGKKAVIQRMTTQAGDVPLTFADIFKSAELLNYAPKIKIEEGIPRFIDWFKKQHKG